MSAPLALFHALQSCISAVAGLLSGMAIYNLQQWEPQSEKASKYSNKAATELHRTRTTQTSGALAALSSLVCSATCAISVSSGSNTTPLLLSAFSAGGILLAYRHISEFWSNKAKVPLAQSYNDGIRSSQQMLQVLGGLGFTWAFTTAIYLYRVLAY